MYGVEYTTTAAKQLSKIAPPNDSRIATAVEELAANPRNPKVEKLEGENALYRRRVGDFRVIFRIDEVAKLVSVVRVMDRKEVYKKGNLR